MPGGIGTLPYTRQKFAQCTGEINVLPWSEMDSLQHETGKIQERLVALNRGGLLTVNSQPAVNGAPSADPHVGWGATNGCG